MLSLLAAAALAAPQLSAPRGLYDEPFALTLAPGAGGAVFYGLDGASPTTPYAEPIPIEGTTIVRAIEVLSDGAVSDIETRTYVFVDQVLTSSVMDQAIAGDPAIAPVIAGSLRELPTVSLTIPAGLSLTEVEGSAEWIDPGGEDAQVACGVHIVGGTSWAYEKASIRLNFRSEYGVSRWELDVYGGDATGVRPADEFDALTLRSGNHDTVFYLAERGQQLRNLWFDETQLEMGHVMPHGRFAHVYVNGTYHGLFHVRERFGAGFMEGYYGGDEADYETWTGSVVEDGAGAAWTAAVAAVGDYAAFQRWVDVPQYLDYMVLNYYAGNAWDWLYYHNWMASGPIDPDARGGFIFHGNDNDITLKYSWDVNILSLGGPADVFPALLAAGDPDFRVALADAIHRNLESDGPLTAENAAARYERLAALADDAIWAESARWGYGWWDHDGEWAVERDNLLTRWFPRRTDEVLRQVREAGWYPLGAPAFDLAPGEVSPGAVLHVTAPAVAGAELWVSVDGRDPRLPGGEPAPGAILAAGGSYAAPLGASAVVQARIRVGDQWGPLERGFFEVSGPAPLALNEWNAVEPDEVLEGGDAALGQVPGNGGDWIELVVIEDGLDLRGWRLTMEDRAGSAGDLTFTDDPLLASLAAGTIITIAEDLAEDPAYDPGEGDWRFHLRAADGASGRFITAADFEVTARDWRLTLWDAAGSVRFGPVGESIEPRSGISGDEVGRLQGAPTADTRRDDEAYGDGSSSTYGAPNTWSGGEQDLGWDPEISSEDPPEDPAEDPPADPPEDGPADDPRQTAARSGCQAAPALARGLLALLALVGCAGRSSGSKPDKPGDTAAPAADGGGEDAAAPDEDGDGSPAGASWPSDCDDADPGINPDASEVCDGVDNDCDGEADEPGGVADGLPFYADADGDGWGGAELVAACASGDGLALYGGDCDDADASVSPGAAELCDLIDQNCDGSAEDGLGVSADCPASSCLELLTEDPEAGSGPYWLAASAGAARVWCDMATDGGGWTLGFLSSSAAAGNHAGFGGSDLDNGALGLSPAEASASPAGHLGWLDLDAREWTELRVAAYSAGAESYRSRAILRSELRIPFGSDGYLLYGEAGYYWCGGAAAYTDAGVGATNNPPGAHLDCKGHGSLGSGWDFSETDGANAGLTLCGADGSAWMYAAWASTQVSYGAAGGAQAIWVR